MVLGGESSRDFSRVCGVMITAVCRFKGNNEERAREIFVCFCVLVLVVVVEVVIE